MKLLSSILIGAVTFGFGQKLVGQALVTNFVSRGVSAGGSLVTSGINPYDTNQLYLVCDMGGVYRSSNQGAVWSMFPSSSQLVTGASNKVTASLRTKIQFTSANYSTNQYMIQRVKWGSEECYPFVSTNNGVTWTKLPTPAGASPNYSFGSMHVDIAGQNTSTQRFVLENYQKIWFTVNGGQTYSLAYQYAPPNPLGNSPSSLRVCGVYWNANVIYIGTNIGLIVSTNGGVTWKLETAHPGLPSGAKMSQFCGAKNPQTGVVTLFGIFMTKTSSVEVWSDFRFDAYSDSDFHGLYSMNYATGSSPWTAKPSSPSGKPFRSVDVSGPDSRYVWALAGRGNPTEILASNDVGNTWANKLKISDTGFTNNQNVTTGWHGDGGALSWQWGGIMDDIDVCEFDSGRVIALGSSPIMTTDGGATWKQIYVPAADQNAANTLIPVSKAYGGIGLGLTTSHWMHWITSSKVFNGCTDVGLQYSADSGTKWSFGRNPLTPYGNSVWNSFYCIVKKTGGTRLYAAVSDTNDIYEPYRLNDDLDTGSGDVLYSDNEGVTWSSLSGPGKGLAATGDKFPGPVVWLAVDPSTTRANYIYASVVHSTKGGIYMSANGGATWTKLANPPRTQGHPFFIGFNATQQMVATYAARRDSNGNFTSSSGVFYSSNGGTTWSDRTAANMQTFTREVTWNPATPATWYAAVQSAPTIEDPFFPTFDGKGGVYRTTNSGTVWTRIFAKDSVQSCTLIAGTTPRLYVTTSNDGLWVSSNPSAATPTFTKVTAFPFARAKRVFAEAFTATPGAIWVTTQGGGVYRGTP